MEFRSLPKNHMTGSPGPDPLFLAFQTALAGRYSIDRELGRGGMGIVYLAREVHLDRLIAIKLLPPALAERATMRERFLREAQLAAKLSHPNIIPIHAVEQSGEFVYYVMSYVEGETLAQRVQQRGPLSATDGIRLLREAAWALGYAHSNGVVHRDVKPDNILIEASSGRAIVADFGIAVASSDVASGTATGTPEFMSPEQAMGDDVDARSDLYSLGATAFYALSGRLPFEGATATEVIARHVTESAPLLSSVSSVPRKLAQLIDRCLVKDPAQRPASAQWLADQLGLAQEQRRELPAPLRAFAKRNGRMDGGGTVLALVGALVASVATSSLIGALPAVGVLVSSIAGTAGLFGVFGARKLLSQGFTQADLVSAFRAELETSREERGSHLVSTRSMRSILERFFRRTAAISASSTLALVPVLLATGDVTRMVLVIYVAVAGAAVAIVSGFAYLALNQMRRDIDVEFWNGFWTGRVGSVAFGIARKWHGAKPMARAMTHRATELSLGMAAEQLFESLPKASRQALGDIPGLLQRLQQDAQRLRERHDALQDALMQSGDTQGDAYDFLRQESDAMRDRMREAVGAMETIRVGLLRLHAGSISLEGLTTHVDVALELSENVERMIAANAEVEGLLRAPVDQLTPV
jgi:serine/threonine-protein kinase